MIEEQILKAQDIPKEPEKLDEKKQIQDIITKMEAPKPEEKATEKTNNDINPADLKNKELQEELNLLKKAQKEKDDLGDSKIQELQGAIEEIKQASDRKSLEETWNSSLTLEEVIHLKNLSNNIFKKYVLTKKGYSNLENKSDDVLDGMLEMLKKSETDLKNMKKAGDDKMSAGIGSPPPKRLQEFIDFNKDRGKSVMLKLKNRGL